MKKKWVVFIILFGLLDTGLDLFGMDGTLYFNRFTFANECELRDRFPEARLFGKNAQITSEVGQDFVMTYEVDISESNDKGCCTRWESREFRVKKEKFGNWEEVVGTTIKKEPEKKWHFLFVDDMRFKLYYIEFVPQIPTSVVATATGLSSTNLVLGKTDEHTKIDLEKNKIEVKSTSVFDTCKSLISSSVVQGLCFASIVIPCLVKLYKMNRLPASMMQLINFCLQH